MSQKKGCIIDTNCLVLFIAESYLADSTIAIPPKQGDAVFQLLLSDCEAYRHVSRLDFKTLFSLYDFYNTTSYIINETQHIINKKIKNQAINSKEVFRYGASLFRAPKQVQDNFIGFVQVVDAPEATKQWGYEANSFDKFGIEDISLITLSQELQLPILTLDSNLKDFIRASLPTIKLVDTEGLLN